MKAVVIASVVSLVLALLGTPMFIKYLVKQGYGQFIRDDGPTSHHTKRGTPTMGGAVIILATVLAYTLAHLVLWQPPTVSGLLVLFLMVGMGAVGFADDFIKISRQRSLGLKSGQKLMGQAAVGIVLLGALIFKEKLDWRKLIGFGLVICGIIGLQLTGA